MLASETAAPAPPALEPAAAAVAAAPAEPAARRHQPRTVHEEVHAHDHPFEPTRTVCIAIDGSKSSEYAVTWAVNNILKAETDQVVVLHVRPFVALPNVTYTGTLLDYGVGTFRLDPMLSKPAFDVEAFEEIEQSNKQASHELLISTAKMIKHAGFHVRAIALRGDPREELVHKIEQLKADLVVMGSRGLGVLSRTFLGSVSDYLTHNLKVPVIVTRLPEA
nr:hypothetical protein HK105_008362 [Polyrhizophydium stewartii]